MKKLSLISKNDLSKIIFFGFLGLIIFNLANAQVGGVGQAPPTYTDINRVLENAKNFIYGLLIAIVVIMLIWAGITFVTAEGDPNRIQKARDRVMYAIIGIVIGLLAAGFFTIIEKFMQ